MDLRSLRDGKIRSFSMEGDSEIIIIFDNIEDNCFLMDWGSIYMEMIQDKGGSDI
jgi:hypothetical protein